MVLPRDLRSAFLRRRRVTPFERQDFALLDGQGEAPMLQFERLGAKKFAPPAGQCRDLGMIVGGDRFEIIDRRDHLRRDPVALADMTQEHAQKLDRRAIAAISALALYLR